jgi:cytochrome c-type biogenesis protein CcmH
MRNMLRFFFTAAVLIGAVLAAPPARAVEPDELLKDPKLEARARKISAGLRCLVCQNQSIDDSNAGLARDLRILVRERLTKGDTDEQAMDFIVARYGEFVLLKPRFVPHNYILWIGPGAILLLSLLIARRVFRKDAAKGRNKLEPQALTEAEEARLNDILGRGKKA